MSEQKQGGEDRGFPFVPVIVSAIVLIAIGALLLNLASSGALPTGLGLGAEMSPTGRGVVISAILAVIGVIAYMVLRRENSG